jgi:tetratricopeptide (TPR) repeat protein
MIRAKASPPESEEAQREAEAAAAINMGIVALKAERFSEALEHIERALGAMPDSHSAWVLRGYTLGYLGRYEEAIANYDRAIEIKPDDDIAWYNRGNALSRLGRYEEAIASYDQAIEIKPDDHEVWYNRGVVLGRLGRYEEELASYDRAIEIKPDYHEAWNNRGNALGNLNRHEEALESYDRAIKIKPDMHEAWHNRGNALDSLGRYEEAVVSYDKVLNLDEFHFGFMHSVAQLMKFRIRAKQSKLDLAKQDWVEAQRTAAQSGNETWHSIVSPVLISVAQMGHLEFVRQLIRESELEEQLFPLARAIDYLLTGDEALIEKLSPEIKGVVEEVINNLRKDGGPAEQRKTKPKARKAKTGSRRRTRKQLS